MTVIVGATAAFFLTMMFKSPTPGDAEAEFQLPNVPVIIGKHISSSLVKIHRRGAL